MATPRRSSMVSRPKSTARRSPLTAVSVKSNRKRSTTATPGNKKSVHRRKSVPAVVSASTKKRSIDANGKAHRKSGKVNESGARRAKSVKTPATRRRSSSSLKKTPTASKKRTPRPPSQRRQSRRKISLAVGDVSKDAKETEERRRDVEETIADSNDLISPRALFIDENKAIVRKHCGTNEKQTVKTLKDTWDYLEDNDNSIYRKYVNRARSSCGKIEGGDHDRTSSSRDEDRRSNTEIGPATIVSDQEERKRKSGDHHRHSQMKFKDVNRPKRALNGYMVFMLEVLPRVQKDMPKSSHKQHVKEIGKRWRNMSDAQKKSYSQDQSRKSRV